MTLEARQAISVGTTPVRLDADPSANTSGSGMVIVPQASGTLVLGPAGVTADTGCRFPVTAGVAIPIDLDPNEEVFGVVASSTLEVDVLLVGK